MFNFKMEEVTSGDTAGGSGGAGGGLAANIADGASGNGQGAVQQPVGDGGGGGGQGGGDGKSWLESLSDDIKSDPSLKVFKDVNGLAKSYVNAQKMIGVDKVVIPGEKATEAEWNAFYNKIGRPESADKYEIKAPDGQQLDENVAKEFKGLAHKLGLSSKQVQGLAEWNFGAVAAAQKAQESQKIAELRDVVGQYKTNLGGEEKYMARVDSAKVALRALAKPELTELLRTSGLGSRPEMIEFFAELRGMMDEGKIRDGSGIPLNTEDPDTLQRSLDELQSKMMSNLQSPDRMSWAEQAVRLRQRLAAARSQPA